MRIFVRFNAHNPFDLIKVNEKILFKLQRQAQHDIATANCNYVSVMLSVEEFKSKNLILQIPKLSGIEILKSLNNFFASVHHKRSMRENRFI